MGKSKRFYQRIRSHNKKVQEKIKQEYRRVMTDDTEEITKAMGRTGIMTEEIMDAHYNVSKEKREEMIREGFWNKRVGAIELKDEYGNMTLKNITYYVADDKGQRFAKSNGVETLYNWSSDHLYHEIKMCQTYHRMPHDVRDTWIVETQNRNDILNMKLDKQFKTYIDATVVIDGVRYGVEIEGVGGYTDEEWAEKEEVSTLLGCEKLLRF